MWIVLTRHKYPKGGPDRKKEMQSSRDSYVWYSARALDLAAPRYFNGIVHRLIAWNVLYDSLSDNACCHARRRFTLYLPRRSVSFSSYVFGLRSTFVPSSVLLLIPSRVERSVSNNRFQIYVYVYDLLISYSWTIHQSKIEKSEKENRQISLFHSASSQFKKCTCTILKYNSLNFPLFLTYT